MSSTVAGAAFIALLTLPNRLWQFENSIIGFRHTRLALRSRLRVGFGFEFFAGCCCCSVNF
jgi:hypothetical protein